MADADPIHRLNAALEGRYRIERELGAGGMATVYVAEAVGPDAPAQHAYAVVAEVPLFMARLQGRGCDPARRLLLTVRPRGLLGRCAS